METEKLLRELEEQRKEINKLKIFCAYVAIMHDDIPQLRHVWNIAVGDTIYEPNMTYDDLCAFKSSIMKAIMEIEDRVKELESKK